VHFVGDQLAAEAGEDGRSSGETCPLLLAVLGGESSHATLVWSHAGQDRSASLASGVSEPANRSDFSDETGGERKKCWRHQSKERRFRSLALSGVVKLAPPVGAGGSERWKPNRPLLSQAGRRILPVDREVKTEIPVKNGQVYVVGGPESVM
jgi:hypothetical protein